MTSRVFLLMFVILACNTIENWPSPQANAQDAVSRLKEYVVESSVFDLPHILHFDIVTTTESETTGRIDSQRIIGRHIHLSNSKFRNDFTTFEITASDAFREEHVFLQMSEDEKYGIGRDRATGELGPLQKYVRDSGDAIAIKYCNPFNFLLTGARELNRQTFDRNPIENFVDTCQSMEESEEFITHTKTNAVTQFKFAEDDPWRIVSRKSFVSSMDPGVGFRSKKVIKKLDDFKGYFCVVESEAKWRDIDGKSKVPFWISHSNKVSAFHDPTRRIDFEAFVFGITLDPSAMETLLDPNRLTDEFWSQDYKPDDIEGLAAKERRLYLKK